VYSIQEYCQKYDVINIESIFHLSTAKVTLFLSAHRTHAETDHMLGYKTNINNLK
jgi:hypothetical protein